MSNVKNIKRNNNRTLQKRVYYTQEPGSVLPKGGNANVGHCVYHPAGCLKVAGDKSGKTAEIYAYKSNKDTGKIKVRWITYR